MGGDVIEDFLDGLVGVENGEDVAQAVGDLAAAFEFMGALFDAAFEQLFGLFASGDVGDGTDDEHALVGGQEAEAGLKREFVAVLAAAGQVDACAHGPDVRVGDVASAVLDVVLAETVWDQRFDGAVAQLIEGVAEHIQAAWDWRRGCGHRLSTTTMAMGADDRSNWRKAWSVHGWLDRLSDAARLWMSAVISALVLARTARECGSCYATAASAEV